MTNLSRRGVLLGAAPFVGSEVSSPASAADKRKGAAKRPKDRSIWTTSYTDKRVWGFADCHSVDSGGHFNLVLSVPSGDKPTRGFVEVYRIGPEPQADMPLIWRSGPVTVEGRRVQPTTAAIGADWPVSVSAVGTNGWRSGYYTIHFVGEDGRRDSDVAYIVITNPARDGDILFIAGTNTYQAYNNWGGYSFYESALTGERAQMLSFDRPATAEFFNFDYFLVSFIERVAAKSGLKVDYATNWDIHRDARFSVNPRLLISGGHNEYWSKEEFDHVWERIFVRGGHTMFLGANAAYWQIRYADVHAAPQGDNLGRQMICFKGSGDPISHRVGPTDKMKLVTDLFRAGGRRPENMLTGNAYQSFFNSTQEAFPVYPYTVARNDFPFYEGTGLKRGDQVGPLVGYEWDNIDPAGDGVRLWNQQSVIPLIPRENLKVLFEGRPIDASGKQGLAEAVLFETPAGARVFSAGSNRWGWGLGKPGFVNVAFTKLNENMISWMLDRKF